MSSQQKPTPADGGCCSGPAESPPTGLRPRIERVSLGPLSTIAALPRAVPFLIMMGLLVGGLLLPGVLGSVMLALVVLVVAWLLYLGWTRLTTSERLGRVAVLALAVALLLTHLFPRA